MQPDILASAARCGARTRAGTPCRSPAVHGRARCRMHGGARGSGAPRGNRNAWKHGGRSGRLRDVARYIRLTGLILARARLAIYAHPPSFPSPACGRGARLGEQSDFSRSGEGLWADASPPHPTLTLKTPIDSGDRPHAPGTRAARRRFLRGA